MGKMRVGKTGRLRQWLAIFKPKWLIVRQLNKPRQLPLGRADFEAWSDRIISGALIPEVTINSQKWTLANLILHLGPTESHKPDAFFIHSMLKLASNQVADAIRVEIRTEEKARMDAEEKAKGEQPSKLSIVTDEKKILDDAKV